MDDSEVHLQSELENARVLRRQDLAERGRIATDIRRIEVGMIERIEKLRSELHGTLVIKSKSLCEIEIKIDVVRAPHYADACGSEGLRSRTERGKCIGIEPALNRALRGRQHGIADEVRPSLPFAAQIQDRTASESGSQTQS